jgi:hypothetical protein
MGVLTMKNSRTKWGRAGVALGLGALALGCHHGGLPPQPGPVVVAGAPNCPAQRLVVRQRLASRDQPACRFERLKARGGTWAPRPLLTMPGAKYAYCAYHWQPDQLPPPVTVQNPPTGRDQKTAGQAPVPLRPITAPAAPLPLMPPDLPAVASHLAAMPGVEFEVDCPVMSSSAPPPAAIVPASRWQPLMKNFRTQASYLTGWPGLAPKANVHVAVVDTAVYPYADTCDGERDPHGRTVGRVITDLACAKPFDPACTGRVHNYLAMPHVGPSELDETHGGFFGTRGELTERINDALDGFAHQPASARLVINLSLGWDAALDAAYPGPISRSSVYDALVRASCMGALTIAAAGNLSAYDEHAILPGAWEHVPAPSDDVCKQLGFPRPAAMDRGPYRPLVYAVGALDGHDVPLAITRPLGKPRLFAYGNAVITEDQRDPLHTALLSGTSMATAVASGAAAAAWAYAPQKDAHAIMNVVYHAAVKLDPLQVGTANVCLGPSCGDPIARVSVCDAVAAVVPGFHGCASTPAHKGTDVALEPLTCSGGQTTSGGGSGPPPPPPCSGLACTGIGGAPPQPWVRPQPPWPRCIPCQISKTSSMMTDYFDSSSAPPRSSVSWVSVWTSLQGVTYSYPLNMAGNSSYLSFQDSYVSSHGFGSAMVSFYGCYDDGFSHIYCGWSDWQSVTVLP